LEAIERADYRANRHELDPNIEQRILLAKHTGAARFAYNWGLARRISLYEESKQRTNAMAQHREPESRNLWDVVHERRTEIRNG
jgi:transposase